MSPTLLVALKRQPWACMVVDSAYPSWYISSESMYQNDAGVDPEQKDSVHPFFFSGLVEY